LVAMCAPYIVVITGANSGIGYEAAKALLESTKKAYHVYFGSRNPAKGETALRQLKTEVSETKNSVSLLEIDVTSDQSIKRAVETVRREHGRIDALINNAGATFDIAYVRGQISLRDTFNKAYDVNVTGAHVTSFEFMPLLLKSSDPRLLFVAGLSMMTQVAKGPYWPTPPLPAGWPKKVEFETIGYRCSKTALNMLMFDYRHKLNADGVKVWSVGPGMLATNLGDMQEQAKAMGMAHPSAGGLILKQVVEGERDDDVGKVIDKNGDVPL